MPSSSPSPLLDLYLACGGPQWLNSSGWSSGSSLCSWFGVGCDADGAVVALDLYGNALTGPACRIPTSLGLLTSLTTLSLGDNAIASTLPTELGNLRNLRTMRMELNSLSGSVPLSLAGLTHLQELDLRDNDFEYVPAGIVEQMSSLTRLQLGGNQLVGTMPSPPLNSSGLRVYALESNRFDRLPSPDAWSRLRVQKLYLGHTLVRDGLSEDVCGAAAAPDVDCMLDETPFTCPLPACLPRRCKATCVSRVAVSDTSSPAVGIALVPDTIANSVQMSDTTGGLTWESVQGGGTHTCGLLAEPHTGSNLRCWGDDRLNQTRVPVGVGRWIHVSPGDGATTCAIAADRSLHCWGANDFGQATVPKDAAMEWADVSAGRYHTCGVATNGTMRCWGRFAEGQTDFPAELRWKRVACGAHYCCGGTTTDEVRCWGCNASNCFKFAHGQTAPPTSMLLDVRSLRAGGFAACALRRPRGIACWGTDVNGEIAPPPLVKEEWTQLSLGRYGGCGITSRHRLLCWGIRGLCREGHSGHCSREAANLPRLPHSAGRWWALGVGSWHGCAIADDRSLHCFGANEHRQAEPPRS